MTRIFLCLFCCCALSGCSEAMLQGLAAGLSQYGQNTQATNYTYTQPTTYRAPTTYRQVGNTVYSSNGTSYRQIGNTVYGSDGTQCRQIGTTVYCN